MPAAVLQPIGKRSDLEACTSDKVEFEYTSPANTPDDEIALSGNLILSLYYKVDLQARFNQLADEWERDRPHGVDLAVMVMHPAYQHIIGMGPQVVPLILARLGQNPGHWFWALYAITGCDPVPQEAQGRLKAMTAAWLAWGRAQGYRW